MNNKSNKQIIVKIFTMMKCLLVQIHGTLLKNEQTNKMSILDICLCCNMLFFQDGCIYLHKQTFPNSNFDKHI